MHPKPLVELIALFFALSVFVGALAYWIIRRSARRWRAVLSSVIRLTFMLPLGFVWLWCLANIHPWFIGLAASFATLAVMMILAAPVGRLAYRLEAARPRDRATKTAVAPP
jgi:hypothetical protein